MGTTNLPNGITNVSAQHIMGDLPIPDPSSLNYLYLDFNTWYPNGLAAAYAAAENAVPWPNHLTGFSDILASTASGLSQRGGRISFVTGSVDADQAALRTEMSGFVIGSRDVWFETTIRARTDVLTQSIQTGISNQMVNTASDGLFFYKANGSSEIRIRMRSNSNTIVDAAVGELLTTGAQDSDAVLGFHWDASTTQLRWTYNGETAGFAGPFDIGEHPVGVMFPFLRVTTHADAEPVTVDLDDLFIAQSRNPAGGYT